MVKKVGKYEIGKTLGEGTFGKVKYAVNTETDERVAIKVLDKEKIQKQNMGAQIKKEISIMKMVRHKHVVVLREVLASRTKIFIVLELITGGELFDKIQVSAPVPEAVGGFTYKPSQAEIDSAILENQDEISSVKKSKDGGLKVMNAFDLINMCGGMALNRMFQSNDEKRVKRSTQFTSTIPAASIMTRLTGYLESLNCEISVDSASKVKAVLQTPKGAVGVVIQIYMLADSLHLVEVRRGKGDIFEYHKFYTQLNEQMKDLISSSSAAN
uniref:non-specific serine/threonine protein kinase n=1 Tax=Globisporangium ultimum (strain ATCC 200006 / CBS 805.95 / DAOM BR144) TaxID=431595 RepID=K3WNX6_GLOUD